LENLMSQIAEDRPTFKKVGGRDIYRIPDSLAHSITSATRSVRASADLPQALAISLANSAKVNDDEWRMSIDPDGLSAKLATAMNRFSEESRGTQSEPLAWWLRAVAERLRSEAGDRFTREMPTTPQVSTSVRLSALLLAGELNEVNKPTSWQYTGPTMSRPQSRAAKLFRDVAAGITWLERRHNGLEPARETIMLAIE
jgi:hypothetical protein